MAENVNPHKYLLWKGKGKGPCRALITISFAKFVVKIMDFEPFMTAIGFMCLQYSMLLFQNKRILYKYSLIEIQILSGLCLDDGMSI